VKEIGRRNERERGEGAGVHRASFIALLQNLRDVHREAQIADAGTLVAIKSSLFLTD
jgi:hypothetical protein